MEAGPSTLSSSFLSALAVVEAEGIAGSETVEDSELEDEARDSDGRAAEAAEAGEVAVVGAEGAASCTISPCFLAMFAEGLGVGVSDAAAGIAELLVPLFFIIC